MMGFDSGLTKPPPQILGGWKRKAWDAWRFWEAQAASDTKGRAKCRPQWPEPFDSSSEDYRLPFGNR